MRFVIYGAGRRGKEMLEVIGKENTAAFVDRDEEKAGTEYCSLPVIGIEDLQSFSEPVLCVLTPVAGRDSIAEYLRNRGILNYIPLKPFDRALYYEREAILNYVFDQYGDNNIGIYGLSAGSVILYEHLITKMNKHVFLLLNENEETGNCLRECGIHVSDLKNALPDLDVIISTETDIDDDLQKTFPVNVKLIKMQELLEMNISFYNKQIECYKDIHHGKRCFIIATGPSLTVQDLDTLYAHNEKCISMNRIYNIFGETKWRPDYYMIEDTLMIDDLSKEIADMDIPAKFVASIPLKYWQQENLGNSIKYQLINLDHLGSEMPFFSTKMEHCVYEGTTVTYACIQMAVYMGFQEIYLLGVDFNYSNDLYDEKNHFKGYQNDKKVRLNVVYPERMQAAYKSARHYAGEHGIKICNATRGGKLEVFERVDFDTLF